MSAQSPRQHHEACLGSGLSSRFGLGRHGPLQLDGETRVFAAKENGVTAHDRELYYIYIYMLSHFDAFNLDAPGSRRFIQNGLNGIIISRLLY